MCIGWTLPKLQFSPFTVFVPEQTRFNFWKSSNFQQFGRNYRFQITTISIVSICPHHLLQGTYCSACTEGVKGETSKSASYYGGGRRGLTWKELTQHSGRSQMKFWRLHGTLIQKFLESLELLCSKNISFHYVSCRVCLGIFMHQYRHQNSGFPNHYSFKQQL